MAGPESWILEVRRRLAAQPPRQPLVAEAARSAVLVPLLVDAGELWALLVEAASDATRDGEGPVFPGSALAAGEDVWTAALRGASEQGGIEPGVVLRLGELEDLELPDGGLVAPCVGALPTTVGTRAGGGAGEVFRVPLSAFANPTLIEDTTLETPSGRRRVRGYHLGSRLVRGLTAHIFEDLLARLR